MMSSSRVHCPLFSIQCFSRSLFNIHSESTCIFLSRVSATFISPFPYPLPPRCFPPRKAGSSRQPFVTVPYLNCFHGFPFRSIHTVGVLPHHSLSSLCVASLRFTNLNYLEGCFDARIPSLSLSFSLLLLHILRAPVGTLS